MLEIIAIKVSGGSLDQLNLIAVRIFFSRQQTKYKRNMESSVGFKGYIAQWR